MYTHGHAHRLTQADTHSTHTNTNRTNSLILLLPPLAEQGGHLLVGSYV